MRTKIADIRLPFTDVYVTVSKHNTMVRDLPETGPITYDGVPVSVNGPTTDQRQFVGQINKGRVYDFTRGLNYRRSGRKLQTNAFAIGGLVLETLRRNGIGYTYKDDLPDHKLIEKARMMCAAANVTNQLKVNKADWNSRSSHTKANRKDHIDRQVSIIEKAIADQGSMELFKQCHLTGQWSKNHISQRFIDDLEERKRIIKHFYMCSDQAAHNAVTKGLAIPLPEDYVLANARDFVDFLEWKTK
jgi:hypothetical protein